MALFPKCRFSLELPEGFVRIGGRLTGHLLLDVPEDIPRAEEIVIGFDCRAIAGYGSGKNRRVIRRELWAATPLRVGLTSGSPLPAGLHRQPVDLDLPEWLPPSFRGNDCSIEYTLDARLDVDWARDPVARMDILAFLPPSEGRRAPVTVRSPANFHDEVVLELALGSVVVAEGEPLTGSVALRSGHGARFDAVGLTLTSVATMAMARRDRRMRDFGALTVPAAALHDGNAVPFTFPAPRGLGPNFRTGFIDHEVVLRVTLDIPWASDPTLEIPIRVLPYGSAISGHTTTFATGADRLQGIARALAEATGLEAGTGSTLVEGNVGPVSLRLGDAPRGTQMGVDVTLRYPDVALGMVWRERGLLSAFRTSSLVPEPLRERYLLRLEPEGGKPPCDPDACSAFVATLLADVRAPEDMRVSDGQLDLHFALTTDEPDRLLEVARFVVGKARAIGDAIAKLPFPAELAGAHPAWLASARELNAWLVPSGPALHGLVASARVTSGETRVLRATLETIWNDGTPATHVDVDLSAVPLPKALHDALAKGETVEPVRDTFPEVEVVTPGHLLLSRPGFTPDPRALVPALTRLLWWILAARGERRDDQAYR